MLTMCSLGYDVVVLLNHFTLYANMHVCQYNYIVRLIVYVNTETWDYSHGPWPLVYDSWQRGRLSEVSGTLIQGMHWMAFAT